MQAVIPGSGMSNRLWCPRGACGHAWLSADGRLACRNWPVSGCGLSWTSRQGLADRWSVLPPDVRKEIAGHGRIYFDEESKAIFQYQTGSLPPPTVDARKWPCDVLRLSRCTTRMIT